LTGCSVEKNSSADNETMIEISQAHYTDPKRCQDIPSGGFTVNNSLEHSHILYSTLSDGYFDISSDKDDLHSQLWVYNIDDGSHNLITNMPSNPLLWFGFLKDGYHFVVSDNDSLLLSNIDSTELKVVDLSTPESLSIIDDISPYSYFWRLMHEMDLSVSPDGKKTAKWKLGDPTFDIIDNDTGAIEQVLRYDDRGYFSGNWSPDSSQYALIHTRPFPEELSQLFLVDIKDYQLEEVARYQSVSVTHPYWSPDGEKIVYKVLDRINFQPTYFHVLNLSTREITEFSVELQEGTNVMLGDENRIFWSPDSQWILFFTKEFDYVTEEWIIDIETINIDTGEYYCITKGNNLNEEIVEWK
jgi:Tol biopolymer transport system component